MNPMILHYGAAGIAVLFSAFGTAIGEGIAGSGAVSAMTRQPMGSNKNFRTLLIGLALTESGGILALVLSLMLLFAAPDVITIGVAWAHMGIALAIGLAAAVVGIASSYAVRGACLSIARQPFFSQKIVTIMLLSQSMIEAPVIFAFIVSLMIKGQITPDVTLYQGLKFTAAGAAMGLGCIGPSLGQAFFSYASCRSVGLNRQSYQKVFAFTLMSQAIIETPVIFCLLLSTLLIFRPLSVVCPLASLCSFASAALCLGIASIGAGVGTGYVAAKSCYQIARPESKYGSIFRATILAQVFIEAGAIYALIISLLLVMRMA